MQNVLLVIHLIIALALVGIILIQKSEGGALGIGGSGGGGAGSIFSARGVGNALTRTTAILAVAFFVTSIGLTVLATRGGVGGSAFEAAKPAQTDGTTAPATGTEPVLPNLGQDAAPAAPATPQVPTNQ